LPAEDGPGRSAQVLDSGAVLQAEPSSDGWFGVPEKQDQMTQPHRGRESYRRALAVVGAFAALATTSCGSPVAGAPPPTPGPVTAASISAAFSNSTMDNAHFRLHGTAVSNRTYYPVTGDGVLQLRPVEALMQNSYFQTFTSRGALKIQEVTVAGRLYTRTGTGKWTSKPTSLSVSEITVYVGEEILDGTAVWHARTNTSRSTYDLWIRESDAYIVQIKFISVSGSVTMDFDTYNKSREILAPKN
jgi:hypothetical protein